MASGSDIGQVIRRARRARDVTLRQLAEMTGLSVSHLSRLEQGGRDGAGPIRTEKWRRLTPEVAAKLAEALKEPSLRALGVPGYTRIVPDAGEHKAPPANLIPVYGTAEGGPGALILGDEALDWIEPPPQLQRAVATAFAVRVVGDSMAPAYEPGDLVYCNRRAPPFAGDDAIFEGDGADGWRRGMVKRLVSAGAENWRVHQFNPAKTFDLPRVQWPKAYKIIVKAQR